MCSTRATPELMSHKLSCGLSITSEKVSSKSTPVTQKRCEGDERQLDFKSVDYKITIINNKHILIDY